MLEAYVAMARANEDHSAVRRVDFDETSAKRGHDYITLFFDLDRKKLLNCTEGKDNETVKAFVADLKAHGGDPETCRTHSSRGSKSSFLTLRQLSIRSMSSSR